MSDSVPFGATGRTYHAARVRNRRHDFGPGGALDGRHDLAVVGRFRDRPAGYLNKRRRRRFLVKAQRDRSGDGEVLLARRHGFGPARRWRWRSFGRVRRARRVRCQRAVGRFEVQRVGRRRSRPAARDARGRR